MSGIAGFTGSTLGLERESVLSAMCARIRHHGPDGEGRYLGDGIALGMRHLAIDHVASGSQPLANEDGSVQLICDGEIYNDGELRAELTSKGHRFVTDSPCEVICHLYEELGPECVERLNGPFGLALWDAKALRLLLARDRFSQKPLYYAQADEGLMFATALKALLVHPALSPTLNLEALSAYITFSCIPSLLCIFREVHKLQPGHFLLLSPEGLSVQRYWQPAYEEENSVVQPLDDLLEEFRALLTTAVERRLVADTPPGAFLSGGIDSSIVVALMTQALKEPIKTFTVAFDEPSFDESAEARRIARYMNTDHRELRLSARDVLEFVPRMASILDEPLGDQSIVPFHMLSRLARERVPICLTGNGADGVLGARPGYLAHRCVGAYMRLPAWLRQSVLAPTVEHLPVGMAYVSWTSRLKKFVRAASRDTHTRNLLWKGFPDPAKTADLLAPEIVGALDGQDAFGLIRNTLVPWRTDGELQRLLATHMLFRLQEGHLPKMDRCSTMADLRLRNPFLDDSVVELLSHVPPALKYRRWVTKYLLKRAFGHLVPRQTVRRSGRGLAVPVSLWVQGELRELFGDLLSPERIARGGFFQPKTVSRLFDEHLAGQENHGLTLWKLVAFELWREQWLPEGSSPS